MVKIFFRVQGPKSPAPIRISKKTKMCSHYIQVHTHYSLTSSRSDRTSRKTSAGIRQNIMNGEITLTMFCFEASSAASSFAFGA
jgi:hypothetical protein